MKDLGLGDIRISDLLGIKDKTMKRKLAIIIFSIFFVVGLVGTFWGTQIAEAASSLWSSCPRGEVNCVYPGECRSYIDTNGDRICDRSQPAPVAVIAAVKPAVTTTPAATTAAKPAVTAAPAPATSTLVVSGPASAALAVTTSTTSIPTSEATPEAAASETITLKHSYYFVPVFLVLAILYALTWILSNQKIIKTLTHRKIWNFVLLISMAISALLGLFLILNIDFNWNVSLPFNMLFWHVEAGIALGAIGAFHIFWHWRYFVKFLKPTEKASASPA
jgi:hypothetical protein